MSGVFLDTVGLLGFWDKDDQWHAQAASVFSALRHNRTPLTTTSYVIAECANAMARWADRRFIDTLVQTLHVSGGLIFPSEADWHEAWARYTSGRARGPGLVDELSFAIMRRLGLKQAFTNDRHFAEAGFEPMF